MKKLFLLISILGICLPVFFNTRRVSYGPGILALQPPVQKKVSPPTYQRVGEYTMTELATFDIKAKVLSKKNYRFGREAEVSPTDLALGWGLMSDERVLEDIRISQSGRFYFWRTREFPIPRKDIERLSANMHLIPFDAAVAKRLKQVRERQLIELSGTLVHVTAADGWEWKSSLTRNDTGKGACEVILVKHLDSVPVPPRP